MNCEGVRKIYNDVSSTPSRESSLSAVSKVDRLHRLGARPGGGRAWFGLTDGLIPGSCERSTKKQGSEDVAQPGINLKIS